MAWREKAKEKRVELELIYNLKCRDESKRDLVPYEQAEYGSSIPQDINGDHKKRIASQIVSQNLKANVTVRVKSAARPLMYSPRDMHMAVDENQMIGALEGMELLDVPEVNGRVTLHMTSTSALLRVATLNARSSQLMMMIM